MKVNVLNNHSNLYELRNKGYLRSIKLVNDDTHTTRDSFVSINNESLYLVLTDVRNRQISLEFDLSQVQRLYELIRKPDYTYPVYKNKLIVDGLEPNSLTLELDDEGEEVLNPSTLELQYEYTMNRFNRTNYLKFDSYYAKVNGDYIIFISEEEKSNEFESLMIFDLLSLASSLVTVQAQYGFGHMSLRSMSFEPPRVSRYKDESLVAYGTSRVFYVNDLIWSVQEDLAIAITKLILSSKEMALGDLYPFLHYPIIDFSNYYRTKVVDKRDGTSEFQIIPVDRNSYQTLAIPISSIVHTASGVYVQNIFDRGVRELSSKAWATEQSILADKRIKRSQLVIREEV